MASSTDSSVFVDAFPTISSHPSGAERELQITVPRFREADSAPMAGQVRAGPSQRLWLHDLSDTPMAGEKQATES